MVQAKRNQEEVFVSKIFFMVKQNKKMKVVLLKYNLMAQTKRKLEKEANT